MFSTLLLATAVLAAEPPIAVRLNNDGRYLPGEGVRVTVRPESDGYLLVLHADPDGRVRVLFPLDPTDDAYVRGGRDYQLRTRGDRRDLFIADWDRGNGTVLAALARDPLQAGGFEVNGHWDYRALQLDQTLDDESALRTIASRLAPGGFDYDVVPYVIGDGGLPTLASDGGTTVVALGVGSCWNCGWGGWGWNAGWWGPGWGWGLGWGWGGWGWNVGWWGPGWGWGWYDPWWGVGPGWGWGWAGWGPGWGGGWGWHNPGWGGGWNRPFIGHEARIANRTWGGQPYVGSGGGVGVRGQLQPNPSLAGAGGSPGYRQRGTDGIGVRGDLTRGRDPLYAGRRTDAGAAPTRLASEGRGGRRLAGGQEATAADVYRSGRRVDGGAPRDVSRGYDGPDRPLDANAYDRGARRRMADGNASSAMPREGRPEGRSYGEPGGTYGRRAYGERGGSTYERTRPPAQYDRGGSASRDRGFANGQTYGGRGIEGRSSGGSRGGSGYAPRGASGGSRGFSGGSMGGGSRGGGFSGGGARGGGGGGGGYRGR